MKIAVVKWMKIACDNCCNGQEWGALYPKECRDCGGSGFLWLSSSDRIAKWPGGPFLGSAPGEYAKRKAKVLK